MVGAERFELPTLWSQTRCATRLRYAPYSDIHSKYSLYEIKKFIKKTGTTHIQAGFLYITLNIMKFQKLDFKLDKNYENYV